MNYPAAARYNARMDEKREYILRTGVTACVTGVALFMGLIVYELTQDEGLPLLRGIVTVAILTTWAIWKYWWRTDVSRDFLRGDMIAASVAFVLIAVNYYLGRIERHDFDPLWLEAQPGLATFAFAATFLLVPLVLVGCGYIVKRRRDG
jgi:hypothetical protein